MYKSIINNVTPDIDWNWLIVEDGNRFDSSNLYPNTKYISAPSEDGLKGISGNFQRNIGLNEIKNGYVYFLDDDNIIHPLFFKRVVEILGSTNKALIFSQINKDDTDRLTPDESKIEVCFIDTAQFLIPINLVGDLRWEVYDYCADGVFFSTVYSNHRNQFIIVQEPLCYYNYLR